jgi:hypothetical protein
MGYRTYEKQAGKYAAETFSGRSAIGTPWENRTVRAGSRQEDWREIMQHGEFSDTDWDSVVRDNAQNLRRTYAPRGDWAKRGDMDQASQHLYDATVGYNAAVSRAQAIAKYSGSDGRDSNRVGRTIEAYGGADNFKKITTREGSYYTASRSGDRDGNSAMISEQDFQGYQTAQVQSQAAMSTAQQGRKESMAKWMAEYNKNLNVHEQIEISKRRVSQRERYADMQIQQEKAGRVRIRQTLRKGTAGLNTGVGSGLNI